MVFLPVFFDHAKCSPSFIVSELIFYGLVIITLSLAIIVSDGQFTVYCMAAITLALLMQVVITKRLDKKKAENFKLFKYMLICQWIYVLTTVFYYNMVAQQYAGDYYTSLFFYQYYPVAYFMFILALISTALFIPDLIKHLRQDNVKEAKFSYAVMRLVNRIDDEKGKSHTYKNKDFKDVRRSV